MKPFFSLIIAFLLTCSISGNCIGATTLYVFYPSVIRPAVLEDILEKICPNIEVSVFGRYQDFKAKVESDHPSGILTKPQMLSQLTGYSLKYSGVRKGKSEERYVFLSIDKSVDVSSLNQKTIGVVDFLGRKGMEDFVKEIIHGSPKITRVTKIEDLIPLLTFNMADAVLVNESTLAFIKKTSNLNFVTTEIPNATAGILMFANSKKTGTLDDDKCVVKLPENVLVNLGIEQWK